MVAHLFSIPEQGNSTALVGRTTKPIGTVRTMRIAGTVGRKVQLNAAGRQNRDPGTFKGDLQGAADKSTAPEDDDPVWVFRFWPIMRQHDWESCRPTRRRQCTHRALWLHPRGCHRRNVKRAKDHESPLP